MPITPVSAFEKYKFWFTILSFVLPSIVAIIITYGAAKFTGGAEAQHVIEMDAKILQLEKELEYTRANYPTRQEIIPRLDDMKERLKEIKAEINK